MSDPSSILVVDDDVSVVELWVEVLEQAGLRVVGMTDPVAALERAIQEPFDLVLCDVEMPRLRGPDLLERLLAARPAQLVVLITAFGTIESAVESLRRGAVDFVSKPCEPQALIHVVRRALREHQLRREVVRLRRKLQHSQRAPHGMIAQSPAMLRVLERARRVAQASGPVLLQGESGTGKTVLAKFIHEHSQRVEGPFVSLNASTLPEQIAEAELFGVKRGAYTDAVQDRPGLLRTGDGGSVFLDEVVELPLAVQAKLLTVVESGKVRPVGDASDVDVDVRLIAASNMDLGDAVQQGVFRADLRFRLDVLTIRIPPLRDRQEDLRPLAEHWLDVLAERHGRDPLGISPAGWRWLHAWGWPGNVRELMNRLERAIVFSDSDFLGPDDFDDQSWGNRRAEGRLSEVEDVLTRLAAAGIGMADLEERYIQAALRAAGGNKTDAARLLGIDRRTVYRKLGDSSS